MMALSQFCQRFGLDEQMVSQTLAAQAKEHDDDSPWYMQALLGIGAWVTAIAALVFVGFLLAMAGMEEPSIAVSLLGLVLFGFSLSLLRKPSTGPFVGHMAIAFAVAGAALTAFGFGAEADDSIGSDAAIWVATLVSFPLAAAAIWCRSLLLQFLISSMALGLLVAAIYSDAEGLVTDLVALVTPIGLWLRLRPPPKFDFRPTAYVLLLLPLGPMIFGTIDMGWGQPYGLVARTVCLASFAALTWIAWRNTAAASRTILLVVTITAALVSFFLPPGGSAAMLLMMLAYVIGVRSLAAIATCAMIYFIFLFYYDLQSDLLTKSIMLMAVGAALLICYGLLAMRSASTGTAEARSA